MKGSLYLGRVMGISFGLHYSWFPIFALLTATLALEYFPEDWSTASRWPVALATSLLFFASILAHELAHSAVAMRNGIPVKSITLFFFGGMAQISREARRPATELTMAAVGPLCSVAIGAVLLAIWALTNNIYEPVALIAIYLASINFILAAFNMVPGFPLDGGRILRSLIWLATGNRRRATRIATISGRAIGHLFVFAGLLSAILFLGLGGLMLAVIGFVIQAAASSSYRQLLLRDALEGLRGRDVLSPYCPVVSPDLSLRSLVEEFLLPSGHRFFLVGDRDVFEGAITPEALRYVPRERWATTPVGEVMTAAEKLGTASPDEDALSILERMEDNEVETLPVIGEGRVLGIVEREYLLQIMHLRSELRD